MGVSLPPVKLDNQVVLVTGGGRGIGRAIAQLLAASGAAVAISGRSEAHLDENVEIIRGRGGRAMRIAADVSDKSSVSSMVKQIENQLGPIDVLVNNAGVAEPLGPIAEVDPDSWWHLMEVNMRGPFLCTHTVLPSMIQRKRGIIINVVSGAGARTIPYFSGYCVSKAALIRFTDCLAAETKEYNIAAFSVNPGAVLTDMTKYSFTDEGKKWASWVAEIFAAGTDVPPEVPARLVAFLASGVANRLSGRFISVQDDLLAMLQRTDEILQNDSYMMRLRRE